MPPPQPAWRCTPVAAACPEETAGRPPADLEQGLLQQLLLYRQAPEAAPPAKGPGFGAGSQSADRPGLAAVRRMQRWQLHPPARATSWQVAYDHRGLSTPAGRPSSGQACLCCYSHEGLHVCLVMGTRGTAARCPTAASSYQQSYCYCCCCCCCFVLQSIHMLLALQPQAQQPAPGQAAVLQPMQQQARSVVAVAMTALILPQATGTAVAAAAGHARCCFCHLLQGLLLAPAVPLPPGPVGKAHPATHSGGLIGWTSVPSPSHPHHLWQLLRSLPQLLPPSYAPELSPPASAPAARVLPHRPLLGAYLLLGAVVGSGRRAQLQLWLWPYSSTRHQAKQQLAHAQGQVGMHTGPVYLLHPQTWGCSGQAAGPPPQQAAAHMAPLHLPRLLLPGSSPAGPTAVQAPC
mmetsp:Transcript_22428/g.48989  ORF Transcript_22428/g.48989 Transcript_22428/m.48989 type:complete len:405 (-) Transcript_22428:2964-4178(-)